MWFNFFSVIHTRSMERITCRNNTRRSQSDDHKFRLNRYPLSICGAVWIVRKFIAEYKCAHFVVRYLVRAYKSPNRFANTADLYTAISAISKWFTHWACAQLHESRWSSSSFFVFFTKRPFRERILWMFYRLSAIRIFANFGFIINRPSRCAIQPD